MLGAIVLDGVHGGDCLDMLEHTAAETLAVWRRRSLLLLQTHFDNLIALTGLRSTSLDGKRRIFTKFNELVIAGNHGRELALRDEAFTFQDIHDAIRKHYIRGVDEVDS